MKKLLTIFLFLLPVLVLRAEGLQQELSVAKEAARLAGQKMMHIYQHGKDEPVLTDAVALAHTKSEKIIFEHLQKKFPDHGYICNSGTSSRWWEENNIWFFDPLDGIQEFYEKGSRFCVTMGFVRNGTPVLGVYYFPATDTYYWATQGEGAYKQIGTGPVEKIILKPSSDPVAVFIHRKSVPFVRLLLPLLYGRVLSQMEEEKLFLDIGSLGYRICQIAEGTPNVYIAETFRGKLWDFAAGQVILQETGGLISDLHGKPLLYRDLFARIHEGVLICNKADVQRQILLKLAQK